MGVVRTSAQNSHKKCATELLHIGTLVSCTLYKRQRASEPASHRPGRRVCDGTRKKQAAPSAKAANPAISYLIIRNTAARAINCRPPLPRRFLEIGSIWDNCGLVFLLLLILPLAHSPRRAARLPYLCGVVLPNAFFSFRGPGV